MNYIAILRNEPCFLFSHINYRIVSHLAYIQYPRGHLEMQPVRSTSMLKGWTDLEMRLLFKNTTGKDTAYKGEELRAILIELADRWPTFEGDVNRLEKQAEWLGKHCERKRITFETRDRYVFVEGANVPALMSDVASEPAPIVTMTDAEMKEIVAAYRLRASATVMHAPREEPHDGKGNEVKVWPQAQPTKPAGKTTKAAASTPAPKSKAAPTAATAKAAAQKRTKGGLCGEGGTVFKAADVAWEAAGKPKKADAIKQLRKTVAASLVAQGVNKTTAGVQLLAWAKARGL